MKRIAAAVILSLAVASPALAGDVAGIPLTLQFGNMDRAPAVSAETRQVSGYVPGSFLLPDVKAQSSTGAADDGKPAVLR